MPYIICCVVNEEGNAVQGGAKGLAERAFHPDDVNTRSDLRVDTEYYLAQQVGLLSWNTSRVDLHKT